MSVIKTNLCYTSFFMLTVFTIIFNSTIASPIACQDTRCSIHFKDYTDAKHVEEVGQGVVSERKSEENEVSSMRFFRLIGSHPPDCKGKCGTCTPCTLTLEKIPPSDATDPAPERWMCKCGNKLYDPYGKI